MQGSACGPGEVGFFRRGCVRLLYKCFTVSGAEMKISTISGILILKSTENYQHGTNILLKEHQSVPGELQKHRLRNRSEKVRKKGVQIPGFWEPLLIKIDKIRSTHQKHDHPKTLDFMPKGCQQGIKINDKRFEINS